MQNALQKTPFAAVTGGEKYRSMKIANLERGFIAEITIGKMCAEITIFCVVIYNL